MTLPTILLASYAIFVTGMSLLDRSRSRARARKLKGLLFEARQSNRWISMEYARAVERAEVAEAKLAEIHDKRVRAGKTKHLAHRADVLAVTEVMRSEIAGRSIHETAA